MSSEAVCVTGWLHCQLQCVANNNNHWCDNLIGLGPAKRMNEHCVEVMETLAITRSKILSVFNSMALYSSLRISERSVLNGTIISSVLMIARLLRLARTSKLTGNDPKVH